MKRISKGKGVYARATSDGKTVHDVTYLWRGKKVWESHVTDSKGRSTLGAARRLKAKRERQKHDTAWMPPHLEQKIQAKQDQQQEDARRPLLFEVASAAFLEECAEEYSTPGEMRCMFANRLALVFNGRYLDEIKKSELRQYSKHRREATGPFTGRDPVGLRPAGTELTALSALYSWISEEGGDYQDLVNPCNKLQTKRKTKGAIPVYKPVTKPVLAIKPEQRQSIFDAAPDARFRAFVMLCYYTAARPECGPCGLLHGDVELPEPGKVQRLDGKPVLGRVTYRGYKGRDHTVLLHPDACEALRPILDPDAGPDVPVFRKRRSGLSWSRHTYQGQWTKTVAKAAEQYPELAGMWMRWLRKTARTVMTSSKVPEPTIRCIMAHALDVSMSYYELTDQDEIEAILCLGATPGATPQVADIAYTAPLASEESPKLLASSSYAAP